MELGAYSVYAWAVFFYLGLLALICIIRAFYAHGDKDFMLGGRNVTSAVLVFTLIATWTGSGSLLGGAGLAYRQGYSELWMSVGAWVAILLCVKISAKVRHLSAVSLPEILERRYNSFARFLGSIALIIGAGTIVGYQFKAGAYVLELIAHIPYEQGLLIMAVAVVLFTSLAGMKSILSIDIINGLLILLGIFVAIFLLMHEVGGFAQMKSQLPETYFSPFGGKNILWGLAVFFPVFLLLLSEPSMYQKFSSAHSEQQASRSIFWWFFGVVLIDVAIVTLALLGKLKFPFLEQMGQSERVILDLARFGLPVWAGVLLLTAAMAIIFSTANSFLLAPATNLTHDIVRRFIAKKMKSWQLVLVNRLSIVVIGFLAYVLLTHFKHILNMLLLAYTMMGAALTPALLAAFFWKRATTAGGVLSILGGIVGTIGAKLLFDLQTVQAFAHKQLGILPGELGEYVIIPAALFSTFLLVMISIAGPEPESEKWLPFFETKEADEI